MKHLLTIFIALLCLCMTARQQSTKSIVWEEVRPGMLDSGAFHRLDFCPPEVLKTIKDNRIYPCVFLALEDTNHHLLRTANFDIRFRNDCVLEEDTMYELLKRFFIIEHLNGQFKVIAERQFDSDGKTVDAGIIGWISDSVPLQAYYLYRGYPFKIHSSPTSMPMKIGDTIGPHRIDILDQAGGWVKIKYLFEGNTVVGWIMDLDLKSDY